MAAEEGLPLNAAIATALLVVWVGITGGVCAVVLAVRAWRRRRA